MTKTYFDNDVHVPDDLTIVERDLWRISMYARASVHIPPEIWIKIRHEAMEDIEERRARGVR